jgi:hypothetical protein
MTKFKLLIAGLFMFASAAQANTISTSVDIGTGYGETVQYVDFHVTDSGFFNISAVEPDSSGVDPYMILFYNPLSYFTDIEYDDNDGSGDNAFIDRDLSVGSYVLALSTSILSLSEAVNGYNSAVNRYTDGWLNVSISSYNGTATFENPSAVPVPAAAWLFGSALIGFAGMRKRKSA